jgi:hypothetical protein
MQKKGPGNESDEDYLSMFRRAQEKDSEKFPWILTNFTPNQMEQIQKAWRTELFTATQETMKNYLSFLTY